MSAVGAAPGFAYPELSYGESELLSFIGSVQTSPVNGSWETPLFTAGGGEAAYVTSIRITYLATAAVGTRTFELFVLDADGNGVGAWVNPQTGAPSISVGCTWSTGLSNAYAQAGNGYSPMTNVILVPGWTLQLFTLNAAVGDQVTSTSVTGNRIPFGVQRPGPVSVVAPVLLT